MSNQTKGLAALLAAHGRNGDTELVHVNKRELAALEQLGNRHGIHTTTNPHTGLKEAFNWQSAVGGVLGGVAGTFAAPFTAGIINPYTGAALGSAAGTKLSGGSTEQALTNGLISGVTAWGMGGVSDALAEAGKEATGEVVKTGVQEGTQNLAQQGTQNLAQQGTQNLFTQAGQSMNAPNLFTQGGEKLVAEGMTPQAGSVVGGNFVPTQAPMQSVAGDIPFEPFAKLDANAIMPDTGYYGAENIGSQGVNTYTSQGTKEMVAAGANPNVTSSVAPGVNTLTQSGTNADYWSNVGKGLGSLDTPGKAGEFAVANKGNLIAAGAGGYGIATAAPSDQSTGATDSTGVDMSLPASEVYYTDTGERRTRVIDRPRYGNVNMARGGDVYGDYDGVDEAADGGYRPGGGLNYANGGLASYGFGGFVESIQPGGAWGNATADLYGVVDKNTPFMKDITPGGAIGQLQPGRRDWERKQAEEAQRKKDEEAAGIAAAAKAKEKAAFEQQWSNRYVAPVTMAASGGLMGYATGGISSLGHYSDGGQLLRGPGDGVSDSIPASIEGKRPARLADGEFVIPARAVSELGNGSTEAGSKQLYAMLDRIAKKRKTGKGLAYQSSPKKIMPV